MVVVADYLAMNDSAGLHGVLNVCADAGNTFSNTLQVRPCKLNCRVHAADGLRKYFRLCCEVLCGV